MLGELQSCLFWRWMILLTFTPWCRTVAMPDVIPWCRTVVLPDVIPWCRTVVLPDVMPRCRTVAMPDVMPRCRTVAMPDVMPRWRTVEIPDAMLRCRTVDLPDEVPWCRTEEFHVDKLRWMTWCFYSMNNLLKNLSSDVFSWCSTQRMVIYIAKPVPYLWRNRFFLIFPDYFFINQINTDSCILTFLWSG